MSRASADRKDLKGFEQLFHQLQPRFMPIVVNILKITSLPGILCRSVSSICGKIMRVYKFLMSFIYLRLYIIVVCPISAQNVFIRNMRVL